MADTELSARRAAAAAACNNNTSGEEALIGLVEDAAGLLETVTDSPDAVNAAIVQLIEALRAAGPEIPFQDRDWREDWFRHGGELTRASPCAADAVGLFRYGHFGLNPGVEGDAEAMLAGIGEKVDGLRRLLDKVVTSRTNTAYLEEILVAAEGRYSLDTGNGLSVDHLAALSGLGVRSVRNLLTPAGSRESGLKPDAGGLVAADQAATWLATKPGFRSSIWHLDVEVDAAEGKAGGDEDGDGSEWLFVPVAFDGTAFTPDLWRGEGYTVGEKGSERVIDSYRAALDHLTKSARPRWRRPNPRGHWGIVECREWRRRTARSLGLEA